MSEHGFDKVIGALGQARDESVPDLCPEDAPDAADETTGASPGTAQACDELGLNSLAANLERFGIKPPGQS